MKRMVCSTSCLRASALGAAVAMSWAGSTAHAQQGLTLQQVIEIAQQRGAQARSAEHTRDAALANYRAFSARRMPQISLQGDLPSYNRSIISAPQPDGSTLFRAQEQTNASLNLVASQQIPQTGASLTVGSQLQQLRRSGVGDVPEAWNSVPVSVTLRQPIMRSNGLRWDKAEQDLQYDFAERRYREDREDVAVAVTTAFFDLYAARVALQNAALNAARNDTLYRMVQARQSVGAAGLNEVLQSELASLRAQQSVDQAQLTHDRAMATLRIALKVAPGAELDISPPSVLPAIQLDTTRAVAEAIRNRADIVGYELQATQARRAESVARLDAGIGATLLASYGYNTSATEFGAAYRDLLDRQTFQLSVQVPLVHWGANSAEVQAARAQMANVAVNDADAREQIALEATFAVRQLEQARRGLALAAKGDSVAAVRFEVAYQNYVIGRVTTEALFIAQQEKDAASQQFVQSQRDFWTAYYRLRRVTMYDFERETTIR
jgi:outer membrane protein TolC